MATGQDFFAKEVKETNLEKGEKYGYPPLDENGLIPPQYVPDILTSNFKLQFSPIKTTGFNTDTTNVIYLIDASTPPIDVYVDDVDLSNTNIIYGFKKVDSSSNPVDIWTFSGLPIDNFAPLRLEKQYDTVLIGFDGVDVRVLAKYNSATENFPGIAEIATQAEVHTGTDDERIITPLKLESEKGIADGICGLDNNALIPQANLPPKIPVLEDDDFTGTVDDYALSDIINTTALRLETFDGNVVITGIVPPSPAYPKGLLILNADNSNQITFNHNDAGSLAANRIMCPNSTNFTMKKNTGSRIVYDTVDLRWRVIATS